MYAFDSKTQQQPGVQVPPQNIEVEDAILGGIMLDPNALERIKGVLPGEAFYLKSNREIYEAAVSLSDRNYPTDLICITNYLSEKGLLEKVGGKNKLVNLLTTTVSSVNVDALAALVVEKWRRRKMISLGDKITRMGYDQTEQLDELLEIMQKDVYDFCMISSKDDADNEHAAIAASEVYSEVEAFSTTGEISPVSSGFYDFDAATGGLEGGQMMLIAARPGMGKSAIAQDVAWHVANNLQKPVFFYSLEMSKKQLARRLAAKLAQIELSTLRSGKLSDKQWKDFAIAVDAIGNSKLFFNDKSDINMNEVKSSIRKSVLQGGREKPGLIIIDYLQLLAGGDDEGDNIYARVTKVSRQLKQLALELDVPVIALSQLSRGVESRDNKRPRLSDLRESGALEQDADIVTFLYREEIYTPDTCDRGIAEWAIAKQRDGALSTSKLLFDGQFTQFKNLARNR